MNESEGKNNDVPQELKMGFWMTVITLNLTILGISIGVLLWIFTDSEFTLPALTFGAANLVFSWFLYRKFNPQN